MMRFRRSKGATHGFVSQNTYLLKMQRKIMSLKKKLGPTEAAQQPQTINQTMMPNAAQLNAAALNTGMPQTNVIAATSTAAMNAMNGVNPMAGATATTSNQMAVNAAGMGINAAQFQNGASANPSVNVMNNFQQSANVMATNGAIPATTATTAGAAGLTASTAGTTANGTVSTPTSVNMAAPPHQQAQQWLQRIQVQFQAQQQQLLHTQNQEIQQMRQQHLNQQQQLAQQQQQQGVSPELRRQQLQQLQQQHQLARTRLQQLHKGKQQQLQRKQQQYLLQKQQQLQQQQAAQTQMNGAASSAATTAMMGIAAAGTTSSMSMPNATTVQTMAPNVASAASAANQAALAAATARNVKPEQVNAAHNQQAAMREMQRAQNTVDLENSVLKHVTDNAANMNGSAVTAAVPATNGDDNASYVERLKELRRKYWDDLVIVFREFERMVKQKPASQQQERINTFLVNLKRIIALLQQDPSKATNTRNDLDRVETHIQKQVLPILERLKNKTRGAGAASNTATTAQQQQEQQQQEQLKKQQMEQQRLAQLQEQQKKLQEQHKAEQQRKLLEEQQKKKLQLEAANAAAKKQQEIMEQQRKQKQLQQQQQQLQQRAQQQALMQQQRQKLLQQQQQQQLAAAQLKAQQTQMLANGTGAVAANGTISNGEIQTPASAATPGATVGTPTSASVAAATVAATAIPGVGQVNGVAALTPAQYRTFKIPDNRKQQLTAQHAKLREQQQELILQQSRAKTPGQQAKLAQQAQRLAHMINKISQQLVQCKLAEEYEQAQGKESSISAPPAAVTQATLTSASIPTVGVNKVADVKVEIPGTTVGDLATDLTAVDSVAVTAVDSLASAGIPAAIGTGGLLDGTTLMTDDDSAPFKSVVPDLTGLGASEKLLTAVAAYEKHKPEVLKRGANRFARVAVAIGAKLTTSYVAT